jgi:hypothetical protein
MNQWRNTALHYLASQQRLDGSFTSYSSPQLSPFLPQKTYHTTLVSALLLDLLCDLEEPAAQDIRKKLAAFLMQQKSDHWSFNYWARNSAETKRLPYPDDLDDTFCALSALWKQDRSLLEGAGLANAVKLLIATETAVGGPYRTWLVPKNSKPVWLDIDIAVTANVAYFLVLAAEPLPNLTNFMEQIIHKQQFASPYYPNFYPVIYYLARAYRGPKQQNLADFLLRQQKKDGSWGTPLHTALAVISLLQLAVPPSQLASAVHYLEQAQASDGSWPAEAFCLDPARYGATYYNGSAALTTGFALAALCTYHKPTRIISAAASKHAFYQNVVQQAEQTFKTLGTDLGRQAQKLLEQTMQSTNANEIIMLPLLVQQSLKTQIPTDTQLLTNLALANLYGWIAYTTYDDFLDAEGSPRTLPAANAAMRQSLDCFSQALLHNAAFARLVRTSFNTMDAANTWEMMHCRFEVSNQEIALGKLPAYGTLQKLYQRSLGHSLPALGVLAAAGISPTSNSARSLQKAFQHYIIAKQLNDDAHDWKEDLAAGRITFVLAESLRALKIKPGVYAMPALLAKVEPQFWRHTMPAVCERITWHIQQGRQELAASATLQAENVLSDALADTAAVVVQTQQMIKNSNAFLQAYSRNK